MAILGVNADYDYESEEVYELELENGGIENYYKTLIYDFKTKTWTFWARLPLYETFLSFHRSPISAVLYFDNFRGVINCTLSIEVIFK